MLKSAKVISHKFSRLSISKRQRAACGSIHDWGNNAVEYDHIPSGENALSSADFIFIGLEIQYYYEIFPKNQRVDYFRNEDGIWQLFIETYGYSGHKPYLYRRYIDAKAMTQFQLTDDYRVLCKAILPDYLGKY